MNSQEAMNYDQYKLQKLNAEFGDYVFCSANTVLSEENVNMFIKMLGEQMGEIISERGYMPSENSKVIIKVPGSLGTADPSNPQKTIAGKVECNLTATKDQYVLYASKIIDELKAECRRQIEKTWRERLDEYLAEVFNSKFEYSPEIYEPGDPEYSAMCKFEKQKNEFLDKIEVQVSNFKFPTFD